MMPSVKSQAFVEVNQHYSLIVKLPQIKVHQTCLNIKQEFVIRKQNQRHQERGYSQVQED